jgi:hypothetical protein
MAATVGTDDAFGADECRVGCPVAADDEAGSRTNHTATVIAVTLTAPRTTTLGGVLCRGLDR